MLAPGWGERGNDVQKRWEEGAGWGTTASSKPGARTHGELIPATAARKGNLKLNLGETLAKPKTI